MTVTRQQRLVIALVSVFFIVLLPFLHVYANNVTNLQIPVSGFRNQLLILSAGCFAIVWGGLEVVPASLERYCLLALGLINVGLWMQINFFIGEYGFLDGGEPEWQANRTLGFVQVITFLIIGVLFFKFQKQTLDNFIFGAIVLVLSSLVYVPQLIDDVTKQEHKNYTFLKQGIFDFSRQQNVIIFVLDTMQADVVNEVLNESPELRDQFEGFTFFRNSVSAFPKTYASIPALLSGQAFDNSETLGEYLDSAYIDDSLPAHLIKAGFDVRLWSSSPHSLKSHPFVASNVEDAHGMVTGYTEIGVRDLELVANMVIFRLAPHFAKPWIYNNGDFRIELELPPINAENPEQKCQLSDEERRYSQDIKTFDTVMVDEFLKCSAVTMEKSVFRFYHLYGAHAPYRFDKDFNFIGNQPLTRQYYKGQLQGSLELLAQLLNRLKELGIYERASIVVAGDHGEGEYRVGLNTEQPDLPGFVKTGAALVVAEEVIRGAIALTMMKPSGSMSAFQISDAPVSVTDIPVSLLTDANLDAADFPGRSFYTVRLDEKRIRHHKHYRFSGWNVDYLLPITEYEIDGFSWFESAWRKSERNLNTNATRNFQGLLLTLLEGGNLDEFQHDGWTDPTATGRKIRQQQARVHINYNRDGSALLNIVHNLYENAEKPEEQISVSIEGRTIVTWVFRKGDGQREKTHLLDPSDLFALESSPLVFQLAQPGGKTTISEIRLSDVQQFHYNPGKEISFKDTGNSSNYRTHGWSRTEFWGTSSIGHESGVFLNLGNQTATNLVFTISGYVFETWPEQQIEIVINGQVVKTLVLSDTANHEFEVPIPPAVLNPTGLLDIVFRYRNAVKPSEVSDSGDSRTHAINMITFRVDGG